MKIQILKNCIECGLCEWMRGKPRCKHPELKLSELNDDGLYYPRCPTDGTRDFREDCPLQDIKQETLEQLNSSYEKRKLYWNNINEFLVDILRTNDAIQSGEYTIQDNGN